MNRKEELMQYISVLRGLRDDGFKCEQEIGQALKELHALVLDNSEQVRILVLEDDVDSFEETIKLYRHILSGDVEEKTTYTSPNMVQKLIVSDRARVSVVLIKNLDGNDARLKGWSTDYIINNTSDLDMVYKINVRIKNNT